MDGQEKWGLNFIENPWQGSFAVDDLTDIVEEAVYEEFEAISERGGVLGAMVQRGKIQEESMYYEHKKRDGSLPLEGVNMFLPKEHAGEIATEIELIRSTEEEKGQQSGTSATGRKAAMPSFCPLSLRERARVRALLPPKYQTPRTSRIFRTLRANGAMCSRG
ncbi:methylmalonyl-CoA mutase family protein [Luteimonas sp. XNQY3]|nr:methylmalonyl-CoA mutase family protein [Luteimonas sp. XNQY3]MCD9008004.1 methylmalonyl-CoA mutase family protein [Luteimonas sp. XNQY3]